MTTRLEPRPFDPQTASDSDYAAINAFYNALRAESWPEDAPQDVELTQRRYRNLKHLSDVRFAVYFVWHDEKVCAEAGIDVTLSENLHLAFCGINVLSPYRRQGLATSLLPYLTRTAQAEGRRLLNFGTDEAVPAGAAFATRLGAKPAMKTHINQLSVAELDTGLIERWQAAAPHDTFELGFWDGPFPEDDLAAIAKLIEVMNTAPRDNLEMEDFHFTPEELRERERYQAAVGTRRWVAYVRERSSGALAGYSETTWNSANPRILGQGDTGVQPAYRGHGLGKWLKAAMLGRVLNEEPEIAYVRTGNADSNGPMLAINHALGFKPRMAETFWELSVEKLTAYLETRPAS